MKKSIKRRWAKNILLSIVIVLLICSGIILFSIYNRYHNYAEQTIKARITKSVDTYFMPYSNSDDETFALIAAEFVDSFLYKDTIEVWVLDKDGNMIVSSSGFSEENRREYIDFSKAMYSDNRIGSALTRLESGEHITAVTYILRDDAGNAYGALRYMISMQDADNQFILITVLVAVIFVLIVLIFAMSGVYFISSIVNPLQRINQITKEIAKGNFNVRIESENDDEIGDLAASINDMAHQLSEIDEMKNDFISTVSHEIRTPLTAIKGWSETLKNIDSDPTLQKKGLDIIIDETTRLSVMVEELLSFSRMQSGKLTANKEKINLNLIAEQAFDIYKQKCIGEDINLNTHHNDKNILIYADKDKILQVLINILDNALKYNHSGGKIDIVVEKYKKYGKVTVSDTGCGIDKEDLKHVKDKFYKANNTVRGTGIGLAVVDEIITMHSGIFDIKSEKDKGTVVEIYIPLYSKESEHEQK